MKAAAGGITLVKEDCESWNERMQAETPGTTSSACRLVPHKLEQLAGEAGIFSDFRGGDVHGVFTVLFSDLEGFR